MAQPDNQSKRFFESLSGAGKSIAVLTSGGDAQGTVTDDSARECILWHCISGEARKGRKAPIWTEKKHIVTLYIESTSLDKMFQ